MSYTLQCAVRFPLPEKKEVCPSLTGDNNLQISHQNNWKMKIVYNFVFRQAVIVYFYPCFNIQEIAMPNAKY